MKRILSAGAVPVRVTHDGSYEFLLLRAFNNWDFPKGIMETGEDPWPGALREVEEETGLTVFSYPIGKDFIETEPYGKNKIVRYYLLKVEDKKEVTIVPNPKTGIIEHHEFRWVSYQEALKLVSARIQNVLKWAHQKIH